MNSLHDITFFAIFITLLMVQVVFSLQNNPLDRIIAHAHVRGGKLYACPSHLCEMEPSTKLYFWIKHNERAPNMFLRSRSTGNTIAITTEHVTDVTKIPKLTRTLKNELREKGQGHRLQVLQAEFPNNEMHPTTYTFLMTSDFHSWIAADMTCERVNRPFEWFRRGQRLACQLDKNDWIDTN